MKPFRGKRMSRMYLGRYDLVFALIGMLYYFDNMAFAVNVLIAIIFT